MLGEDELKHEETSSHVDFRSWISSLSILTRTILLYLFSFLSNEMRLSKFEVYIHLLKKYNWTERRLREWSGSPAVVKIKTLSAEIVLVPWFIRTNVGCSSYVVNYCLHYCRRGPRSFRSISNIKVSTPSPFQHSSAPSRNTSLENIPRHASIPATKSTHPSFHTPP